MQSSPIKKSQKKAFQEYAKQRSTALKAAFPMKSDKEILQMMEKQWIDTHQKSYSKSQVSQKQKSRELVQEQSSSRKMKDPVKKELVFSSSRKQAKIEYEIKQQSEVKGEISEEDIEDIQSTPSKKEKRIYKRSEFSRFSQFYNYKLRSEHPKWSTSQISTIVSLLWRKKMTVDKERTKIPVKKITIVTGKKMFNNNADGTKEVIQFCWKALPRESKKYWKKKGLGIPISYETPNKDRNARIGLTITQKSPLSFKNDTPLSPLSFMNNIM